MSESAEKFGVVVVAAGSGSRMRGQDKQTADLRGRPVFMHSLLVFDSSDLVDAVSIVFSASNIDQGRRAVLEAGLTKVAAVVKGGRRRQDSVLLGIEALERSAGEMAWIAVHDGARPFVDEAMLRRGKDTASAVGAAVAAVAVTDTIKQVGSDRVVVATPDRASLWAVQTPQVFRASVLKDAHANIRCDVTDDASMVEQRGGKVAVFEGDYDNIKITTPGDMALAETIWDRRNNQRADRTVRRWGTGFDGHRLVAGGPLRLGGVDIPFEMSLQGHSDGDVLLHAIASAFLGAAGIGDLGTHFPSSDPAYRGIDSSELVRITLDRVRAAGWLPEYLDATIIAQRPRLSTHVPAIRQRVAEIAGLSPEWVNVKVTSTDHVGAIGEGKGIAAQATATVRRSDLRPDR